MPDNSYKRKPDWLKIKLPTGKIYASVKEIVKKKQLHTICESGNCPNMGECWGAGTATFLILGDICTRSCRFCAVKTGKPLPPDLAEPEKIARSVQLMKLKHVVLTSVDRDDLKDGGSKIWAATIAAVRRLNPHTTIEALVPDFQADSESMQRLIDAAPEVISHNLETVRRLSKQVRIQAKYERSLEVLRYFKAAGLTTKSGIMLGLGESESEIIETLHDLKNSNCDILTLGQYLQPSRKHLPVNEYVTPAKFEFYRKIGLEIGFKFVESAPLVRSSYHAEKHV